MFVNRMLDLGLLYVIGLLLIERGHAILQSSRSAIKRYEHDRDKVIRCYASWVLELVCPWLVKWNVACGIGFVCEF